MCHDAADAAGPETKGAAAAFCSGHDARLAALATATRKTGAVADAMAKTVAREGGAAKAGNKQALAAQQANVRKLLPQLVAAAKAEAAAGARAAALLRANHVDATLAAGLVAKDRAYEERRLASLGVSKAAFETAAGTASHPITLTAALAAAG